MRKFIGVTLNSIFGLSLMCLLFGCAGPTSPFGGLNFLTGDGLFFSSTSDDKSEDVLLNPSRQMLHKTTPLKVEYTATSTLSEETKIHVTYNNKNVTRSFQKYATLKYKSGQQITYIYPKLRLKPDRRHQIDIYVKENEKTLSHTKYLPPECSVETPRAIASIEPFKPEKNYLNAINSSARENQMNPSLLAGLIAQESGFESDLVSHSKAVGLTQVTPLADAELKKLRPEWSRDGRIDTLNPDEIEELIRQKKISSRHDWRLNPFLAIEGGALYLNYLRDYWMNTESKALLQSHPSIRYSEVILASYNSGASRVKSKIQKNGIHWLEDNDLKEAFKYVNSVESYCFHFSEETK